jgi:hypothetical protein
MIWLFAHTICMYPLCDLTLHNACGDQCIIDSKMQLNKTSACIWMGMDVETNGGQQPAAPPWNPQVAT